MDQHPMHSSADQPTRGGVSRRSALQGMSLLGAAALFAMPHQAGAQDASPTPGAIAVSELAPGVTAEVFAAAPSARAPGQTVYLARFHFEPGKEIFPHSHPGTTVLGVAEGGSFGWTLLKGTAHVVRASASGSPAATEDLTEANADVVLEPGDAIYIPFHWWHGVESLEPFNLFVNYWWSGARSDLGRPYDALMHAFFALKHLPPEQRAIWRTMFDHYVFEGGGDPAEHLPAHARGMLGEPTAELLARMRATLKQITGRL